MSRGLALALALSYQFSHYFTLAFLLSTISEDGIFQLRQDTTL